MGGKIRSNRTTKKATKKNVPLGSKGPLRTRVKSDDLGQENELEKMEKKVGFNMKRSIFDNEQLQYELKKSFLASDLIDLSRRIKDQSWMERFKKENPQEDEELIIKTLKKRFEELNKEYTKLRVMKVKGTSVKKVTREPIYIQQKIETANHAYIENLNRSFTEGIPSTSYRNRFVLWGLQGINSVHDWPDSYHLSDITSSANGYMIIDEGSEGRVNFSAFVENPRSLVHDNILVVCEVDFLPPPAPWDGTLRWQGVAKFFNHHFINNACYGRIIAHVVNGVNEDVNQPAPVIHVYVTGNMWDYDGESYNYHFGNSIWFGSEFNVVKGQQSLIGFLLLVRLSAWKGTVSTEGEFGFVDPDHFNQYSQYSNGIRYMFIREYNSSPRGSVDYLISVRTGDFDKAGTNANVFITLYGTKGQTGEILLDNPGHNDFERAQTDRFIVSSQDIGDLTKIFVRHDNTRRNPGWYLDHIIITNNSSRRSWTFNCDRWLDLDKPDPRIALELFPVYPG